MLIIKPPEQKKRQRSPWSSWRIEHGVAAYYAKNWTLGSPWVAFFTHPKDDPEHRSFNQLVEQYSLAACFRRGLIAEGRDRDGACAALAALNGIPAPLFQLS